MFKKLVFVVFLIILFSGYIIAQKFSIAVIPDSQNYTDFRYQTFSKVPFSIDFIDVYKRQIQYIVEKTRDEENPLIFAIHLGDNVLHQNQYPLEWDLADESISLLDDVIPFGMIPGNHDYDYRIRKGKKPDRYWSFEGTDFFTYYFGSESNHFADKEWYISSFNKGLSSAILIKNDYTEILFIGLEMEAGDSVLNWAQNIIDAHKNIPTIVATHEYISVNNEKNETFARRLTSAYRRDFEYNTAVDIWNKFITKNNQIFLVLCGHSYDGKRGENSRVDLNEAGFPVYQFLSDYEGRTELFKEMDKEIAPKYGGDGWMRFLNFDLKHQQLEIKTYSTELKQFETDENSEFLIALDWEERFN